MSLVKRRPECLLVVVLIIGTIIALGVRVVTPPAISVAPNASFAIPSRAELEKRDETVIDAKGQVLVVSFDYERPKSAPPEEPPYLVEFRLGLKVKY